MPLWTLRSESEVYIKGNNEAAYAAYRTITGADVKESWRVVKPWLREWGGKDQCQKQS